VPLSEGLEILDRHSLAQNSAVRLAEYEPLDLLFSPADEDHFIHLAGDTTVVAQELYVEDSGGRRYRVQNDTESLKVFLGGK
jgi:hypothetical protein